MQFRDRPLLVDGVDSSLYVERTHLEQSLVEPLFAGRNVLLLGEAGSGKSTLLRKVASSLEDRGRPVATVNAALADDATDLLDLVRVAVDERLGPPKAERPEDATRGAEGLLRAVRRLRGETELVILVDGLIDADVGYDTFGRLRDELWALGHAWMVAVRPRDSAVLRTPPADAFWSTVMEIPPLDQETTSRLLRRGLSDQELRIVERDQPIAGAHPRYVIRAAQDALAREGAVGGSATGGGQKHLEWASQLGRGEAMVVAELIGLGRPLSAHDPDLLQRLGWSRPYAQRILSHLEDQGVLRSIPERNDRPGRPRKLYELNPDLPAR